jgi:adenine-specific DNA-methyltransferase
MPDQCVDLIIASPPYCMGREYDLSNSPDYFVESHRQLLPELSRVLKDGGSICWQVGYHVQAGVVTPLDYLVYQVFSSCKDLILRNRIVWTFGHGLHGKKRFSGRHELILWFSKGNKYYFDLDSVRVPQKYPGKTHYRGQHKGSPSGNPAGKNPSDVWEIPNVKAKHLEKTAHPCQFPVVLAQRLIRAICPSGGRVLDPFMGAASAGVAALIENRKFVGAEIEANYYKIAFERCQQAAAKTIRYRADKPILQPTQNLAVARKPDTFQWANSTASG